VLQFDWAEVARSTHRLYRAAARTVPMPSA